MLAPAQRVESAAGIRLSTMISEISRPCSVVEVRRIRHWSSSLFRCRICLEIQTERYNAPHSGPKTTACDPIPGSTGGIFMTAKTILAEIKPLGNLSYKKVLFNHGVAEPCFGVKVEHLKKIQKRIKKDYQLALDL